ncbi:hypothetical protein OROMI_001997 [Orobanche minor]
MSGVPCTVGRSTGRKRDNGRRSLVNKGTREVFSPQAARRGGSGTMDEGALSTRILEYRSSS